MWKESLPQCLTMYLLQQIRAAVEGVDPDADVEGVLAAVLNHVFVAADPGGLECLAGQLLQLVRDQVDGQWELVHAGLLAAEVKDPNLWVRHTAVEPRLRVRLVLAVPVALGRTPTHLVSCRSESSN